MLQVGYIQAKLTSHVPAPNIITTAPTMDFNNVDRPTKKKSQVRLLGRKKPMDELSEDMSEHMGSVASQDKERRKTMIEGSPSGKQRVTFEAPERPSTGAPPAYGDESSSALALPVNRMSESERSDGSSGDHGLYAATTTTTHTVHTTTTFFRLPRRKKPSPLFDLGHLPRKSDTPAPSQTLHVPHASGAGSTSTLGLELATTQSLQTPVEGSPNMAFPPPLPSPSRTSPSRFLSKQSSATAAPGGHGTLLRHGSNASSSKSSPTRRRLDLRGRSSTLSSLKNAPTDEPLPTPTLASTRTSTSTGRKSFGDLFGLSARLRQNSEPPFHNSGPGTPRSANSKDNSISLPREPIVIPERHNDDTPLHYLKRLEEAVSRGVIASILSKGTDQFSQAVLRSYMRGFSFFGDPMDMAIRKLLMEVELPKETQHIDRCLQGFANRYYECNPGIYDSPDQAYFVAFSLLILHTDVFNKNNKHKMQKPDYLKNTRGEGIFDEILDCFYDNISYTPFIHVEDDLDINGERIVPHKFKKKTIFPRASTDTLKRTAKEPVDPYALILDGKVQTLRPEVKHPMHLEEHYSYLGTASALNLQDLQKTFFRTGVLQIVSPRSRPDAFMSEKTVTNPEDAHPGIVDIKITKVGLLWRKDAKKKKTRSPWQEWGAILTGAQLYFFRNTAWVKSLMHQYETHTKQGQDGIPVIFKPPLEQFKPDALMSTDDAVALLDSDYKKHKNAFIFIRHGGCEETFLADNEYEMNDWLAKLNYAAAFRTSGVRMRGVVGGNYEGQKSRGLRRLDGQNDNTKSVQTPTGEVTISSGKVDTKMAQDILAARREIMLQKIADAEEKIVAAQKQLDSQLRNARHLQILAPIQPKTREQVLLAAGRLAAHLKWGRMEMWRLRCHKDILTMDLEEEKVDGGSIKPTAPAEKPTPERGALGRLQSITSSLSTQRAPRSPTLNPATRPSTSHPGADEQRMTDDGNTTPVRPHSSSYHKAQASWELPPLNFDASSRDIRKSSFSSIVPSSPASIKTLSHTSLKPTPSRAPSSTPQPDAAEQEVLEQSGLVEADKTPESKRPNTEHEKDESRDVVPEKEKHDKSKLRRSLQRTLRDTHTPTHHRSRKGKDPVSSAATSEDVNDDVLSRGSGSFVVHGKKASVITFGSELSHMTPEERLRLRNQPHKDGKSADSSSPVNIEEDFHSVLAEPYTFHERHDSAATTSTTTARSFRELHQRRSGSHNKAITSDAEDSEAISLSDEIKVPLPAVESEDDSHSANERQAVFYTPEMSNSLTAMDAMEDNQSPFDQLGHSAEHSHDAERQLRTPSPQATVGA